MTRRAGAAIIPIAVARAVKPAPAALASIDALPVTGLLHDRLGRRLHDLRISVTDRCNFRCTYCMPKDVFDRDHRYLPHTDLLTFEEISRLASAFVAHGVEKIRLTGGEPLLRRNIETLIARLATLRAPDGRPIDLTLTTNGSLLRRKAAALRAAGLKRLTVSLDALDDVRFRAMNDVDFPVAAVLDGIDAATEAGFGPIKVNMVVKRGVNDDQVEAMARYFRGTGHILRFIEFMDVGVSNHWRSDEVVPSAALVERLDRLVPIEPVVANYVGEVAERWRYRDGSGEIGFISSVTQPFCGDCSRARLSPEGTLYTCLFASSGTDFRSVLRSSNDDHDIQHAVRAAWTPRGDRYSESRGRPDRATEAKIEMSYIGG